MTIAQSFAHAPKLDPSGTSWLPFPFWALGAAMTVAGRSLATARVASIAFASLAVGVLYLGLRAAGITRGRALLGVGLATLSPWSVWLGAATVPESFTASLTAAAAVALGARPRAKEGERESESESTSAPAQIAFALGLFAAALSRYEVWPVAAVLALALAFRAARAARAAPARTRGFALAAAGIAAAGPLLWMAWNVHAHGDALHFFARVTRFKRALGEGSTDTVAALLLYPRLLVTMRPDVLVATGAALVAARTFVAPRDELRGRWLVPLACALAQLVFLAYGNARDGAPAHHSERALLGIVFILAAFAADVLAEAAGAARSRARSATFATGVVLAGAWLATTVVGLRDVPGTSAADDRRAQLDAGARLHAEGAAHLVLAPCAYEHFALIAAFGAPERVTVEPGARLANGSAGAQTGVCPAVERR